MTHFTLLPCIDSEEIGQLRKNQLDISRHAARELGHSAVEATRSGHYYFEGKDVNWQPQIERACSLKESIAPDARLPQSNNVPNFVTKIQVSNETTLGASKRLVESGLQPLALNFANAITPGGGFLTGSRAQEEFLCRSSALFATLDGDRMYDFNRDGRSDEASDWIILSPDVPIFRDDYGKSIATPWLLSIATAAAPYAPHVGQPLARQLLRRRIKRLFAVANAYGHVDLVLGAWGCGAFGNDPNQTATDFRDLLLGEFAGRFRTVLFAITDWSLERRFIKPFTTVFSS